MNVDVLRDKGPGESSAPDEPEGWQPRRPRWGRRLAILALLTVVALAVSYRLWLRSTRNQLNATLDALRREGEPVDPGDLARPPVPAADNAAFDLRAAATLIDTTSEAWKTYQSVPFDDPLSDEARKAVADVLKPEAHRQALARARAGRSKHTAEWKLQLASPLVSMLLPDLNPQRSVADLCRAAAVDALLRKDYSGAIEYARDTLGVGRAAATNYGLIGHLVSTGMMEMTAIQVEQMVRQMQIGQVPQNGSGGGPATPEQVRALILDLLDETAFRESLVRGMRDERVMELDTAMAIADGKVSLSAVAGRAGGPFGGMTMVPRPMILADAKLLVDFNTATIKALQKSPDYPTFRLAAPPSPLPPAPGMNGGGYAMARLLLPAYDRAVQTHYRCLGDRRMAAAALAVRWYQADHGGQPPATLDELVPKYLPSVPLDPFAAGGRPLRYVSELERLVVYSVGENGTDEAGNAAPTDPRRVKPGRWEQLDAVFPLRTKPPSEK